MSEYRIPLGYVRGPAGTAGKNFEFKKTYTSVSAMNADFSGTDTSTGDYVLIAATSSDDADNGRLYRKGESTWIYVARINGPTGAQGQRGPMPPLVTDLNVTIPGEGALDASVGPRIAERLVANGGDTAENMTTFSSSDTDDTSAITGYETMPVFEKGQSGSENRLKTLFATISKAVKNIRYLIKLMGSTDISAIGSGTVTDILSALNSGKFDKANVVNNLTTQNAGYSLDARQGRALSTSISSLNDALATTNTAVTQLRTLKRCEILMANPQVITRTAGDAFCYYFNNNYVIVFATLAFRSTVQRAAGTSVFRLSIDGKDITVNEPYNLPCIMSTDNVMKFAGYSADDNRFFAVPSAWPANTDVRYSGVFSASLS